MKFCDIQLAFLVLLCIAVMTSVGLKSSLCISQSGSKIACRGQYGGRHGNDYGGGYGGGGQSGTGGAGSVDGMGGAGEGANTGNTGTSEIQQMRIRG